MPARLPAPPELGRSRAARGDRGGTWRKLLSLVEQGGDGARGVVSRRCTRTPGGAWSIGITGAPGAGKSTLTDQLVARIRARTRGRRAGGRPEQPVQRRRDPRRPRAHAEPLDRHRCLHPVDGERVATSAGLAVATPQAVRVLDAVGKPWIVVETVGVGQVEVEIAGHADTTVVVVNPGWGDAVQAAKAGLLEIADVFVVNKADRPGAADTVRDLEGMLELAGHYGMATADRAAPSRRRVPASTTCGTRSSRHREHLELDGEDATRRRERLAAEVRTIVAEHCSPTRTRRCRGTAFESLVDSVVAGERNPYDAADALLDGHD